MKLKSEYKYRLKEKMNLLTHDEYKILIKALPHSLGISQRTYYRYINVRIGDHYSIPVDDLARLARFFRCRIEDLLNFEPPLEKTDKLTTQSQSKLTT